MVKDLQLTLYEFFGYLLPGVVVLTALALLFWCVFCPASVLPIVGPPPTIWIPGLFIAYLLGHVAQGVVNDLGRARHLCGIVLRYLAEKARLRSREHQPSKSVAASPVVVAARRKLAAELGIEPHTITNETLYSACRHAVAWTAAGPASDIFVYREGFYRALTIGLFLLSASLLSWIYRGPMALQLEGTNIVLSQNRLWFVLGAVLLAFVVAWRRERRFAAYRDAQAILAFVLCNAKKAADK